MDYDRRFFSYGAPTASLAGAPVGMRYDGFNFTVAEAVYSMPFNVLLCTLLLQLVDISLFVGYLVRGLLSFGERA